jgi:hypothetical protein
MASQLLKEFIITSLQRQPNAPCSTADYDLRYDPENGNVDVVKRVGINIFNQPDLNDPCEYIFRNGSFTPNALASFGQSNLDKLYTDIKQEVTKRRAVMGGNAGGAKKPAFLDVAKAPIVGSPSQLPNPAPPVNGGGLTGANGNPLALAIPVVSVGSTNENKLFGTAEAAKLLIYPEDLLQNEQDNLRITQYNYVSPTGKDFLSGNVADILTKGLQRNSATSADFKGTVILPIPNNAQDNNSVSWGPDTMNNLNASVMAYMQNSPAQSLATIAGGKIAEQATGFNPTQLILIGLLADKAGGLEAMENSPLKTQLQAALASYASKQVGFEIPAETILSRGLGIVPNSNLELLFNSPTLRDFSFGWRMTPRSDREAKNVRRIIRFFKQGMAVRKVNAKSSAGAGSLFLGTPNIFKLEYKSGSKSIPGLNRFKMCALTGFTVNYSPEGQWASYDDPSSPGQPVSVTMGMSFTEIEPIYESDYQESIFEGLTPDLDKISDNDIGY